MSLPLLQKAREEGVDFVPANLVMPDRRDSNGLRLSFSRNSPEDIQDLYLGSLSALGIDPEVHDIRFVEDNWESPTLGAWGLGWEVWLNGMEVTQFTYFQQVGGLECRPVMGEITYGSERLAMIAPGRESIQGGEC